MAERLPDRLPDRLIDQHAVLWGSMVLRRRREALGVSRGALAEQVGIGSAAIRNLERGRTRKPDPRMLRRLCDALALPLPGEEGLYLCLDGVAARGLRRVVATALTEFAVRRRDARRFIAQVLPRASLRQRRAAITAAVADRDVAHRLLALLRPVDEVDAAEVVDGLPPSLSSLDWLRR